MKQNTQKGIRGALVFLPLIQTVITLSVQAECKMMDMILLFEMLALGCAGAFCISFGKRMFERLLVVSGMGTLVMVLALSGAALPVNWETILIAVLFSVEFLLSILYAIGRRYWLFL